MTHVMACRNAPGENFNVAHAIVDLSSRPHTNVRLRPIALPSEHGGWGMLGAPILAGLAIAPSWAGLFLALAGIGFFLTRQPFRLALTDLRKAKRYPRTAWAFRFASAYVTFAFVALALAASTAKAGFWPPLALAAVLGAIQFAFDIESQGRRFVPEVCGASALACLAAAIANAGGMTGSRAWLVALAIALQAATAISYASTRVRLARNVEIARWPVYAGYAFALVISAALVTTGQMTWPIVIAFLVLAGRALWGLSPYRRNVRASIVGIQEVAYSVFAVACIVLAVRMQA